MSEHILGFVLGDPKFMTRRDIILQVLSEASGRSLEDAESLLEAMVTEGMISSGGLEDEFSGAEFLGLMEDFRAELPGIRRWLCETGLLGDCGNA